MQRYNTIIFVPHARARFRKLTVSTRLLAFTGLVSLLLFASAVGFGWAYLSSARRDREYRQTVAENARLKTTASELNRRLDGIAKSLSEFEARTQRLAIVAGLAETGRTGQGGPMVRDGPGDANLSQRTLTLGSQLSELESQYAKRSAIISSTPTVAPVRGLLNSGFGARMDPITGEGAFHQGLDISTRRHEPVLATAAGTVVKSGWSGDYGKTVEIAHATGYTTIYGHLDTLLVKEGQRVRRGERVGLVGSTGRSTGPHLHYEVRRGDRAVDPLGYILDAR